MATDVDGKAWHLTIRFSGLRSVAADRRSIVAWAWRGSWRRLGRIWLFGKRQAN